MEGLGRKINNQEVFSPSMFLLFGCVTALLICVNTAWSCVNTFDCRLFWPTVSYMACFRGHDRLFSLTMSLTSTWLYLFFIVCTINSGKKTSRAFKLLYMALGTVISLLLPAIAVIDEASTSRYFSNQLIHSWLVFSLIGSSLVWAAMTIYLNICLLYTSDAADE